MDIPLYLFGTDDFLSNSQYFHCLCFVSFVFLALFLPLSHVWGLFLCNNVAYDLESSQWICCLIYRPLWVIKHSTSKCIAYSIFCVFFAIYCCETITSSWSRGIRIFPEWYGHGIKIISANNHVEWLCSHPQQLLAHNLA